MLLILLVAVGVSASFAHPHLFNPAELGFETILLNQSYDNVSLAVTGDMPAYLNGTLYRGAPGAWPDGWWLDGLITLNAFRFNNGEVNYSMKWSKDTSFNNTVNNHSRFASEVAFEKTTPGSIPIPANGSWPTGVAFHQVDGNLIGSSGVSNTNEIDPVTLEPIQMPFVYEDDIGGPFYAPTHSSTVDGVVLHHLIRNVQNNDAEVPPGYVVTSISPGGRSREIIATIDKPDASSWKGIPSFQHSVSATPDYYVMLEAPCYYPDKVEPVLGEVDWAGWKSNLLAGSHVRLVHRTTGVSTIYPVSYDLFSIHHINAYQDEEANTVVFDVVQTFPWFLPCSLAFKFQTVKEDVEDYKMIGKGMVGTKAVRVTLPLDSPGSKVTPQQIGSVKGMEFPTIRYDDRNGKPYKFYYAVLYTSADSYYYDALLKQNVDTGESKTWRVEGHYPGEPIFVPDPEGIADDDGVVITNVLDTTKNSTYLLVLNATDMTEIATAGPTPHVIPHGYHGKYFDRRVN